jgi:DNA-binding protein Fis
MPPDSPVPEQELTLERALADLFEQPTGDLYAQIEARVLRAAYLHCDRNQLATARLLGISRNIVRARLIACGVLKGPLRRAAHRRADKNQMVGAVAAAS